MAGRLTDIFGRREGYVAFNIAFGLGTLLCGLATKEWVLILGRAVAGLGGGALMTIASCVSNDLVPLRKRGIIQGSANIVIGVGSGLGGLLGGWIDGVWGWRIAFLIQVPIVALGTTLVWFNVKIPVKTTEKSAFRRVDYLGSLTLTCALVLFLLGLNTGGNVLPWTHPLVVSSLPLSGAFLLVFIYVEEKVAVEPVIPVRLLLDRTVASACMSYCLSFMAYYGVNFHMPIYLELLGKSPTEAGLRFIPYSAACAVGAFGMGIVMTLTGGYWYLNKASHVLLVLGSILMTTLQRDTPSWCPFLYLSIFGFGFGGMLVTTLVALVSSVKSDQQSVVTSTGYAFRAVGSVIGLAVCSAAFQNVLRVYLSRAIGGLEDADHIINRIRDNFDEMNKIDKTILGSVQESYMQALRVVFFFICGFSVLAALTSLLTRQNKLHTKLARR